MILVGLITLRLTLTVPKDLLMDQSDVSAEVIVNSVAKTQHVSERITISYMGFSIKPHPNTVNGPTSHRLRHL